METSKKEVVLGMAEKSRYKVVLATMWKLLEWAEKSKKEVFAGDGGEEYIQGCTDDEVRNGCSC